MCPLQLGVAIGNDLICDMKIQIPSLGFYSWKRANLVSHVLLAFPFSLPEVKNWCWSCHPEMVRWQAGCHAGRRGKKDYRSILLWDCCAVENNNPPT